MIWEISMKIGIIGHVGGNRQYTDGQTAKTKAVIDGLIHNGYEVICADTYFMKNNPIRFIAELIKAIYRSKKIIVLLSKRGRKVLFPILSLLSNKREIYHYAIGGQLANEAEKNNKYKKRINRFKRNWVESRKLANRLNAIGVSNAIYLPNFKCIQILPEIQMTKTRSEPIKFCTFSRVMREKGIEDAIKAINIVNEKAGHTIAILDIFGPIEPGYEERFDEIIKRNNGYSTYRGIVLPNKSVDILKDYYMLLFPTFWRGEGMPGTIIDALSAGVPVIARRWEYCDEMLENNITGYIYDFDQPEELVNKIIYAIEHYDQTIEMKNNCIKKAYEYSEDYVMDIIIKQMNLSN